MKKSLLGVVAVSLVGTTLISSPVAASEDLNVKDLENDSVVNEVAYSEKDVLEAIKSSDGDTNIILPYKKGTVKLPPNYNSKVVVNPVTGESFIKIKSEISTRGAKKFVIVNAFRYGGKALSKVTGVVNDDVAVYISNNSGKIANAIDGASAMIEGEILQALLNAGVPLKYARNIAWAIDLVFL